MSCRALTHPSRFLQSDDPPTVILRASAPPGAVGLVRAQIGAEQSTIDSANRRQSGQCCDLLQNAAKWQHWLASPIPDPCRRGQAIYFCRALRFIQALGVGCRCILIGQRTTWISFKPISKEFYGSPRRFIFGDMISSASRISRMRSSRHTAHKRLRAEQR